jgi:hypothetical protein
VTAPTTSLLLTGIGRLVTHDPVHARTDHPAMPGAGAARGTQGLAAACRGYRDAQGAPTDPGLAACFLDAGEADVVLVGLDALAALRADGSLGATPGLRTQLRMLAQDPDDAVAGAAEALLDGL